MKATLGLIECHYPKCSTPLNGSPVLLTYRNLREANVVVVIKSMSKRYLAIVSLIYARIYTAK